MAAVKLNLLWVFPSFAMGGAQKRFAALVGALGDGYEHAVIAMDGDYDAERMIPEGVAWRRIELRVRKNGGVSIGNMWSFRRVLARERPDLLLTTNWGSIEWLMVNRGPGAIPHIHFEDGFGPDESPGALNPSRSWARRRAFPGRNRRFVAPSTVMAGLFTAEWRAPAEAVALIPNGVDLAPFAGIARRLGAADKPVRIGSVGALRPEKRFDRLLRLTQTLRERGREVELLLVGDGPERAALEADAEARGLSRAVHFAGAQGDVAPFLEQMDLYALTSDTEQAPLSLIEAMGAGLPVVATDVGDVVDMLARPNRVFAQAASDESALAAAAELLCVDPELRLSLGEQNREQAAARFSLETMAQRYDELFRSTARATRQLLLPAPSDAET